MSVQLNGECDDLIESPHVSMAILVIAIPNYSASSKNCSVEIPDSLHISLWNDVISIFSSYFISAPIRSFSL